MFKKILFFALILIPSLVSAAPMPFTDVPTDAPWYHDLERMYNAGVIGDTADHLFRPDGLLPRDEFVGIVVGVTCRKCIYPSAADIIKYQSDPFVDITKRNLYFYCISYAKEQNIVRGYVLNDAGKVSCQNGQEYSETPFCPVNNITRIEAAAVLLRQAGLWNETLNSSSFTRSMTIADIDEYWYGYGKKAVEVGLIKKDTNNKVAPQEYITRREFVTMASKIFQMNMCTLAPNTGYDFASTIRIFDKEKSQCLKTTPETTFPVQTETTYDFGGYAEGGEGELTYTWEFYNTTTRETKTASGQCLDNFNLETAGIWLVKMTVTDGNGRTSTSYDQVYVGTENRLTLRIQANPIWEYEPLPVSFTSFVAGGKPGYTYRWDFKDGSYSSEAHPAHTFQKTGVYPVSLIVRDTIGNTAFAQVVIQVVDDPDRDHDGTLNVSDVCPDVYGPRSNRGCPLVGEYPTPITSTNRCLLSQISTLGAIEGGVACTSCPCDYSLDFLTQIRRCDIIFPTILSRDKATIYSRGGVYQVR